MSDRFGDYELSRYLTAGGMADLYLARSPRFPGQDLVLKRIQQRYLDHTRVVKMFIDEGRIAATLDHPNIVRTVDVGQRDGAYYIAMEYIPGHDLIAIARRGVESGRFVPRDVAVGIVAQVATGLAYAHTRTDKLSRPLAIVHCDISPGNIVVSWRGTAKIVDFGIARAAIQLRKEDGVAGKFNYMAPEQIRGEPVDPRADLFSLGVILYELTLGKRLFKGKPEVVRRKVMEGRIPRPREIEAGYPEALERILARLLARDVDARYPSAAALRSDLRGYLAQDGRGVGKREVALYMRELFRAPRGLGEDTEFSTGAEEEELSFDRGMPLVAELEQEIEFDPDEEVESPAFSSAFDRTDEQPALAPAAEPEPDDTVPVSVGDTDTVPVPEDVPVLIPEGEYVSGDAYASVAASGEVAPSGAGAGAGMEFTDEDTGPKKKVPEPMLGEIEARVRPERVDKTPSRSVKVADLGGTAQVRLPEAGRPGPPAGEPATALVRLPEHERAREVRRVAAATEATELVQAPPPRRRRRRSPSTTVVVGACLLVAAAVLLAAFFLTR